MTSENTKAKKPEGRTMAQQARLVAKRLDENERTRYQRGESGAQLPAFDEVRRGSL